MRAIIVLASIVVATFVAVRTPPAPPIEARTVAIEGVREARQDDTSFNLRWSPTAALPPATTIVKEVTQREPPVQEPTNNSVFRHTTLTRQITARKSSSRGEGVRVVGLCERHHLRKVWQGRSWRCRK